MGEIVERKNAHKMDKSEGTIKKNKKAAEDSTFQIKYEPPLTMIHQSLPPMEEPKIYCSCQQQREGEMIKCDNSEVAAG